MSIDSFFCSRISCYPLTNVNMCHLLLLSLFTLTFGISITRFAPEREQIHLTHRVHPRQWGRWCTNDFECGRGFCQAYVCQCYRGYITWKWMEVCNYKQRTKLTAFLVSFFVGVLGIDWFVLARGNAGYIVAGIIKLLISLACAIGWPVLVVRFSKKDSRLLAIGNVINATLSLTAFVWWLTDWIRILANVFADGHGAPLLSWNSNNYDRLSYRV